nr:hypothetical protein [Tanacetum cinerariifolium]
TSGAYDHEAGSSHPKHSRYFETVEEALLPNVHHEFFEWSGCSREAKSLKEDNQFRLRGRAHSLTLLEFSRRLGWYHAEELDEESFDTYFQGELIDFEDRLIYDISIDDVPRVAAQRAPRVQIASMQDLYARMGVYNVSLQGDYNSPSYAQPQYDQYYQQYYPQQRPQYQHDDEENE